MIVNPEDRAGGAPETASATVTIIIPCRAEYVAIARLAILGVANRLSYSYDEVEDLRLAVGEACTHAVERSLTLSIKSGSDLTISIESLISSEGLSIDVRDNVPVGNGDSAATVSPVDDDDLVSLDKQDLGALLMEILVDSVSVESHPSGTIVHLFKRAPEDSANIDAR